jgi:DNA polymerase-1
MRAIVDLSNLYWRNYFGSRSVEDAISLVQRNCLKLCVDYDVSIAIDSGSTYRKSLFPEYKATRKEMEQEVIDGLRECVRVLLRDSFSCLKSDGHEADDVIATFVKQQYPNRVLIVSNDKDFFQLLCKRVRVSDGERIYTPADCVHRYGVSPRQMVDYLSLVGDQTDNVKGCPGIGPKKASLILQRYNTVGLARVDNHLEQNTSKQIAKALHAWTDLEYCLAHQLVKLRDDLKIKRIRMRR